MKQKSTFFEKLFCVYQGTSDDLVFWVLIDSVFLSNVKGISSGDIAMTISVSSVANLLLRTPCYKLIKKIGNGKSLILGAVLFLGAACCFTFGEGLIMMAIGQLLYNLAPLFQCISSALLMDKLNDEGRRNRFVKIMSVSNLICSGVSVVGALMIGVLLQLNQYLPMFLCVAFCVNSLVLAVMIGNREVPVSSHPVIIPGRRHIALNSAVIKCLIILALDKAMIRLGNTNLKLYFQDFTNAVLPAGQALAWFTVMITSTRVVKLLANFFVGQIRSQKIRDLCVYLLPLISTISLLVVVFAVNAPPLTGAILTAVAFMVVTFSYDPIITIVLEKAIRNAGPAEKPLIISTIEMGKMLCIALTSAISAAILTKFSLVAVVILIAIVTLLMALFGFIWRKRLESSREHFNFYGLESINDSSIFSGLNGAAAFLIGHYHLRGRKSGEELLHLASVDLYADNHRRIIEKCEEFEYDFDTLYNEYKAGHPCAIEILRDSLQTEPEWLPIAYLDPDGGLAADFREKRVKFLSEFSEIRRICSFRIKGQK